MTAGAALLEGARLSHAANGRSCQFPPSHPTEHARDSRCTGALNRPVWSTFACEGSSYACRHRLHENSPAFPFPFWRWTRRKLDCCEAGAFFPPRGRPCYAGTTSALFSPGNGITNCRASISFKRADPTRPSSKPGSRPYRGKDTQPVHNHGNRNRGE